MRRLYAEYIKGREEKLIDAAAAGAALSGIVLSEDFDPAALSPEMREAFELQFPNIPIDTLSEYSADGLQGFLSPWKGKLFEVIVRDDLNDGAWVGDVHLGAGQVAALADSPTQPGWDLQIFDLDGTVADELQLKATDQLSYVKHALERYPDIDVLTTTEAAEQAEGIVDGVMSSGISDEALEESVESAMSPLFDAAQTTLEDFLPILPFVIIVGTEGRKVLMGKKSFEAATASALQRATISGGAMAVGGLVYLLDGGVISIPATIATRVLLGRVFTLKNVEKSLTVRVEQLQLLLPPGPAPRLLPQLPQ